MYDDADMKTQSCSSYTNAIKLIADTFGMPMPATRSGQSRLSDLLLLVRKIVQLECRRSVEEAATRIFRLAVDHLPPTDAEDLYIPQTSIRINAGDVGKVSVGPFNSNHSHSSRRS